MDGLCADVVWCKVETWILIIGLVLRTMGCALMFACHLGEGDVDAYGCDHMVAGLLQKIPHARMMHMCFG